MHVSPPSGNNRFFLGSTSLRCYGVNTPCEPGARPTRTSLLTSFRHSSARSVRAIRLRNTKRPEVASSETTQATHDDELQQTTGFVFDQNLMLPIGFRTPGIPLGPLFFAMYLRPAAYYEILVLAPAVPSG